MSGLNVHLRTSPLVSDSRMFRLTQAMARLPYFSGILLVGVAGDGQPETQWMDDKRMILRVRRPFAGKHPLLAKYLGTFAWSLNVWKALSGKPIRCINCHSVSLLPLCALLAWRHKATLIYDTHELETETSYSTGLRKRMSKLIERRLIGKAAGTIVVGDGIADWYAAHYPIARPTVIRNIPPAPQEKEGEAPLSLREHFNVPAEALLFMYLGGLAHGRGIERILAVFADPAMPHHVAFMGDGPLAASVKHAAAEHANIHHLPPVAPREVVGIARTADVGMVMTDPGPLSHRYSQPNKFFEYITAGLPVVSTELEEVKSILARTDAGWIVGGAPADIATQLAGLTREEVAAKKAGVVKLQKDFTWPGEEAKLIAFYDGIFGSAANQKKAA